MPCDTKLEENETISMRKKTILEKTLELSQGLASGKIKAKVGPQGAIVFEGWANRGPVTDACAYRKVMASGSALAKMAIMRAEQLAGRTVDRKVVAQGTHSHDGGRTWHKD